MLLGFPGSSGVKASACNVGDLGSIPGLGRSPGEGNGNPLQYFCLENPMDCCKPGFSVLRYSPELLKLMSIELVMLFNPLILCCPLLLLPSIFPSIRVFSNESALCIRWPKCWSFSSSISPSVNWALSHSNSLPNFKITLKPGYSYPFKASVLNCGAGEESLDFKEIKPVNTKGNQP